MEGQPKIYKERVETERVETDKKKIMVKREVERGSHTPNKKANRTTHKKATDTQINL